MKAIVVTVILLTIFSVYWFEDRPRIKALKKGAKPSDLGRRFWNESNDLQLVILTMGVHETNQVFYKLINFRERWQNKYGGIKEYEQRVYDLISMYNQEVKELSQLSKTN